MKTDKKTSEKPEAGQWLPIFLRLAGQPVLIAGGGVEARRKIDRLLKHGARVDVLADSPEAPLDDYHQRSRIHLIDALPSDSSGYRLVIVATGQESLRLSALAFASAHAIPVNAVDDPENCTAILPAIVDRAPITIAIGSGGTAPELARMIRSRIEAMLPLSLGPLAQLASELKDSIRSRFPQLPHRRRFLGWLFRDAPAEAMQCGSPARARELAAQALEDSAFDTTGSVALGRARRSRTAHAQGAAPDTGSRRDHSRRPGRPANPRLCAPRCRLHRRRQARREMLHAAASHQQPDARTCTGRQTRGEAQRRRSADLRPRRRGIAVPSQPRHRLFGRARHHRGFRLRRLRRHSPDPSRPRALGAPGHRAWQELDRPAGLDVAGPSKPDTRLLHGGVKIGRGASQPARPRSIDFYIGGHRRKRRAPPATDIDRASGRAS